MCSLDGFPLTTCPTLHPAKPRVGPRRLMIPGALSSREGLFDFLVCPALGLRVSLHGVLCAF